MKIKDKLCKYFGHRWTYYKFYQKVVRVYSTCRRMQYWTTFYPKPDPFWVPATQYTEKGAKELCVGFGKE